MDELQQFLTQTKGEPLAMIGIGAIALLKVLELIIKYIPLFFGKKKNTVEEMLKEDSEDRKARQAEFDKKINEIDAGLNELKTAIAINDKLTEKTWEVLLKVSEDNQYSIFINKDADIVERLKSFRILIAFERNGDVKTLGFALILQHKKKLGEGVDPWRQAEKCLLPVPIKNQKYWDDIMAEINRRIYDGF